jgi:hypothetical protein
MTTMYHWWVMLGLMFIPAAGIYRGLAKHETASLLAGIALLVVIPLLGVWAMRSVPTLLEMSRRGLYVKQYKRRFAWKDIKPLYVIDMAERLSTGEKFAATAAGNRAMTLAMLIGLEFTEAALKKYGVLADKLWQRQYNAYNDHVVIRTHLFALGKDAPNSIPKLVEEGERFRQKYSTS